MTNETAPGDLLAMARVSTKRRLHALAMSSHKFDARQLTLMQSLLDEFARKSHSRATTPTAPGDAA